MLTLNPPIVYTTCTLYSFTPSQCKSSQACRRAMAPFGFNFLCCLLLFLLLCSTSHWPTPFQWARLCSQVCNSMKLFASSSFQNRSLTRSACAALVRRVLLCSLVHEFHFQLDFIWETSIPVRQNKPCFTAEDVLHLKAAAQSLTLVLLVQICQQTWVFFEYLNSSWTKI